MLGYWYDPFNGRFQRETSPIVVTMINTKVTTSTLVLGLYHINQIRDQVVALITALFVLIITIDWCRDEVTPVPVQQCKPAWTMRLRYPRILPMNTNAN